MTTQSELSNNKQDTQDTIVPPISKTAWYTLASRAYDAKKKYPACNDTYAEKFMCEEAKQVYDSFSGLQQKNMINVVRHRIIDDIVRTIIEENKFVRVFLFGSGFDTRAYRITDDQNKNKTKWIEFDNPDVIKYKNSKLPVRDEYHQRVSIDWENDCFTTVLNNYLKEHPVRMNETTVIIYEGVFMYLEESKIKALLQDLREIFPKHLLICDLLSKYVSNYYSYKLKNIIKDSCNAQFLCYDNPWNTFVDAGYIEKKRVSCIEKASELRAVWYPKYIFSWYFFTSLRKGYSVWVWSSV